LFLPTPVTEHRYGVLKRRGSGRSRCRVRYNIGPAPLNPLLACDTAATMHGARAENHPQTPHPRHGPRARDTDRAKSVKCGRSPHLPPGPHRDQPPSLLLKTRRAMGRPNSVLVHTDDSPRHFGLDRLKRVARPTCKAPRQPRAATTSGLSRDSRPERSRRCARRWHNDSPARRREACPTTAKVRPSQIRLTSSPTSPSAMARHYSLSPFATH